MFVFSKLAWVLVQPSNLLLLLLILATAGLLLGYRRFATWLLCGVTAALVVVTVLPVGTWLLLPIENRFAPPALPEQIDGVIMLGGAVEHDISALRGQIALNEAAERVTALVELARRYPGARLVVSGGIGGLVGGPGHPARALEAFYRQQGLDVARIEFEKDSRNTHENAALAKELVRPGPDECWLLVTSAHHMPRSIGVFRQAGWPVIAYPVDYRSSGTADLRRALGRLAEPNVAERLIELDLAIKSWLGLVAYRLLGRTSVLFPAP
ncbi:MAG: YdcF family protein [Geminicoccaceae bacterium]